MSFRATYFLLIILGLQVWHGTAAGIDEGVGESAAYKKSNFGALADHSLSLIGRGSSLPVNESTRSDVTNDDHGTFAQGANPNEDFRFEINASGYGKNNVKLLYVKRKSTLYHEIREYEIDLHLRLNSQKEYITGDNHDVIATDSQKNTIYLLAKKHGVRSAEEFAILLCSHFLHQYSQVAEVDVRIEEKPWARYKSNTQRHSHAFIYTPTAIRSCQVTQLRNESPRIRGGLKDLRVLKTTQSSFRDFVRDDYRTLPDADDRILSTVVQAYWDFSTTSGVDFDQVWHTVKNCTLENFAGPPDAGIFSSSVQHTLYITEKCILGRVDQIYSVEMQMPNKHYFEVDFSKFSKLVSKENKEVYLPVDNPSGIIYAKLNRKNLPSKL